MDSIISFFWNNPIFIVKLIVVNLDRKKFQDERSKGLRDNLTGKYFLQQMELQDDHKDDNNDTLVGVSEPNIDTDNSDARTIVHSTVYESPVNSFGTVKFKRDF